MDDSVSQDRYNEDFGVGTGTDGKGERQAEALKHALDIRKFEIELYWKRASYFWAFIGAALVGYGLVQKLDPPYQAFFSIVVASLGLVFSLAWYCANRGSKYWQESWEKHVDLLEDQVMGPLYKTVFSRSVETSSQSNLTRKLQTLLTEPESFSVSKINQIVSAFVFLLWIPILLSAIGRMFESLCVAILSIIILILMGGACYSIWRFGRTDTYTYELQVRRRRTALKNQESG